MYDTGLVMMMFLSGSINSPLSIMITVGFMIMAPTGHQGRNCHCYGYESVESLIHFKTHYWKLQN